MAVRDPPIQCDRPLRRNREAVDLVVGEGLPGLSPGRWIELQRFLEYGPDEGEFPEVFQGWVTALKPSVYFVVKIFLDLGMLAQQIPRPGQRRPDRFVPGRQQRQGLIFQLLVCHPSARSLVPEESSSDNKSSFRVVSLRRAAIKSKATLSRRFFALANARLRGVGSRTGMRRGEFIR